MIQRTCCTKLTQMDKCLKIRALSPYVCNLKPIKALGLSLAHSLAEWEWTCASSKLLWEVCSQKGKGCEQLFWPFQGDDNYYSIHKGWGKDPNFCFSWADFDGYKFCFVVETEDYLSKKPTYLSVHLSTSSLFSGSYFGLKSSICIEKYIQKFCV